MAGNRRQSSTHAFKQKAKKKEFSFSGISKKNKYLLIAAAALIIVFIVLLATDMLPHIDGSLNVRGGVVKGAGSDDIVINVAERDDKGQRQIKYYVIGSVAPFDGYKVDDTYDIRSDENEFERCFLPEDSSSDISSIYICGTNKTAESFLDAVNPTDLTADELSVTTIVSEPQNYASGNGTSFGGYFQTSITPDYYNGAYYKYFTCYIPAGRGCSVMVFVSAKKSTPTELPADDVMIEAAMSAVDLVTIKK